MSNKNTSFPETQLLNVGGKLLALDTPKVMGILNLTPDSFYDGATLNNDAAILHRAEKMITEGSDILDIGGMSTRPGSEEISTDEELKRVLSAIELLKKHFPQTILSLDTYRSDVAEKGLEAGIDIINDISAGSMDDKMFAVVAKFRAPYIMMHMQGTPQTMQQNPQYENVVQEVLQYFIHKTEAARKACINDIIIDPGFGFGKTLDHNYALLQHLEPKDALNGTTALNTIALLNGAKILRVHDVKEVKEVIKIVQQFDKNYS
jgi:dihydropteroate synthase